MPSDLKNRFRPLALVLVSVFLISHVVPVAGAQLGLGSGGASNGGLGGVSQSVGEFAVAPRSAGVQQADGSVTKAVLSEYSSDASGSGVLRDYSVLGTPMIESLSIAGFQATKSLAGQGSTALTLEGTNAMLRTWDNINSLLLVQNRADATLAVAVELAADVQAYAQTAQNAHVQAPNGLQGHFIVVDMTGAPAKGALDVRGLAEGVVKANLEKNEALVFRATPHYDVGSEARAQIDATTAAIVDAMAAGRVTGEVTSEFRGAKSLFAEASYDRSAFVQSNSEMKGRVETFLRAAGSSAGRSHVLAYDLDYPDLPAQDEDNVAVYVNGVLAAKAHAASEVTAAASQASYHAASIEGRTLVLVNTGASAESTAQKVVTIVAVPDADTAATTLARLNAELGVVSHVEGEYRDYVGSKASGDVAGRFTAFVVGTVDGSVHKYALLEQGMTVFDSVEVAGQHGVEAAVDAAFRAQYHVQGTLVDFESYDQATAALVAEAKADAEARYALAQDVQARLVSENVVELTDGVDVLGHLVLVEDREVQAGGSSLGVRAAGEVVAELKAGAMVVFRSVTHAETAAQARLVAEALAASELASEVNLGVVGNVVKHAWIDYRGDVDTRVTKSARGEMTMWLKSESRAAAESVVVNSDRASLAANSPEDIVVTVRGEAAARARGAAEAYAIAANEGRAAFAVLASAHGAHKVVVAVPKATAEAAAEIAIRSTLEAQNRAAAAVDLFGSLHLDSTTGAATGAVVSFVAKAQASAILDYTVTTQAATTTIFEAVVVSDTAFDSVSSVQAPSVKLVNPEATLEIFDTTSALMQITAEQDTVASFSLASSIEAVAKNSAVVMLNDVSGGQSSAIGALVLARADGTAASSSRLDATAAGEVHAQLEAGARLIFRAYSGFESELDETQKHALAEAIAQGRVAGHAIFTTTYSAAADATLTGHAHMSFIQGVDIVTRTASAAKVEVLVDSATNVGRTVILSLDPMTVEGLMEGKAKLLVDGKAVKQAESYFDVLQEGDADAYWVHTTETGNQVLVRLAHFSTRTISLTGPEAPNLFLFTTIGLGAIVVGQAVFPWLRRKW